MADRAPQTAQCANCERWVAIADGELPPGWMLILGEALCPDCAPAPRAPRSGDRGKRRARALHIIGPAAGTTRYHGCRVGHEVMLRTVGVRIHAGARPERAVRDEPVQFLLSTAELDELIRHLCDIRKELSDG